MLWQNASITKECFPPTQFNEALKVLDLLFTLPFQKFISQVIKNFAKKKITQGYYVRAELSENQYPKCQFSHLRCDFRFILEAQKFNNSIFLALP